jgi:phospholipid/cholesterol/gamma-HCH transport system substrate-binding protein
MPRTRSLAWSELKIGIVAVAALLLLGVVVVAVGGEGGYWWQRYPLKTRFNDAQGLKAGAVVRLSGKEIGAVKAVEFSSGAQIEVTFEVRKDVRQLITTDSIAEVGSLSLLGEPIIDIKGSGSGTPLNDWAYVKASQSTGPIDELTSKASTSLEQMDQLLAEMRAGRGTIGKLVTDDALYNEMTQLVSSAADVTAAINRGRGTLGGLATDPAAYDALKASLQNLQTMTTRINSGQGAMGRFLNDDAMGRSMAGTTANLDQITGRLSRGEGTAGKLLTDQQLYDRLNSMTTRLDQVVSGLEEGRGTAGKLLRDQQLYENMNSTIVQLRNLLAEIMKDPKKYLRVSVSIF